MRLKLVDRVTVWLGLTFGLLPWGLGCSPNLNVSKTYRLQIVDHESGEEVVAKLFPRPGGVVDYFRAPTTHDLSDYHSRRDGTFEVTVRWRLLDVFIISDVPTRPEWPFQYARVRIDRRGTGEVVVESPRGFDNDPDPETRYQKAYPIDEKGVIVVPLFRKPAAGAEGSATQPMTGEGVPAGGDR